MGGESGTLLWQHLEPPTRIGTCWNLHANGHQMNDNQPLQDSETKIASADGTRINVRTWPRPSTPRAVIAFVHGQGDHSGRYRLPATWFTERGIACLAADLRGHGRSGGRRGHIKRFAEYLEDLDALVGECKRQMPRVPLFVVGHSMGGLVLIRWAQERAESAGIEGLIVSSPFIALKMKVPAWKKVLGAVMNLIYPAFSQPTRIRIDHLTHNRSFVRETRADPLYGTPATVRWFAETAGAQSEALNRAAELTLPLLFLVAGEDRLVEARASLEVHEAATSAPREWHLYPGLQHEIFNELRREEVYADLLAWIETVLTDSSDD